MAAEDHPEDVVHRMREHERADCNATAKSGAIFALALRSARG
ncbi:hypothetical protein I546_2445 [Mycobacterium kansasii 732]|nr:hypothetical protein [Mycobacterium pseudokansasii]EUA12331.1 hypothetical protein I546_2445 [Mycobacterium kansasii 732]